MGGLTMRAIVRALRMLTNGVAKSMPSPSARSAKDRTSELTPANFQEHSMTGVGDGRRPVRLDYFVPTRARMGKGQAVP